MSNRTTATKSFDSNSSSTKFKFERVSRNSLKMGPHNVERAVDPSDVVIKRRFGEGSKPLFERADISINRGHSREPKWPAPIQRRSSSSRRPPRHSSSDSSSSTESYRKSKRSYSPPHRSVVNHNLTKLENLTPLKRIIREKTPYFADEKRERERLIRRYGTANIGSSSRRSRQSNKKQSRSRSKHSCSRSLSRSPRNDYNHHRSKSSSQKHRHSRSPTRERMRGFSRNYRRSPHEGNSRRREYRSKSRSRERWSAEHIAECRASSSDRAANATQIITIPVPVDPYSFPPCYPSWPHLPAWAPAATRYIAPYTIPPSIPPYADSSPFRIFPPVRLPPPSFRVPFNTRLLRPRPPRGVFFHPANFQSSS